MNNKKFEIEHPLGFTINKNIETKVLLNIKDINVQDMKNGYVWYRIPNTKMGDYYLVFNLCFYNNQLSSVSFYASLDPEEKSWSNWSKEREIKHVNTSRAWIVSLGYDVSEYDWGIISVEYDSKGGSGGGHIRFKS